MSVGAAGGGGSAGGTSPVRSPERSERSERRETPQPSPQSRADFEQALRSRQSKHDGQDDETQDDERGEAPAPEPNALAGSFAPLLALRGQADEAAALAARALPEQSGTQMKMEAALNASVAPAITEVGANDPAALWEASLNGPGAIPLEVRVLRGERIGNEANAALTVSLRSTSAAVSGEMLARHASKLDERLRKRGVDGMHVRIEDGDEPA